MKRIGNDNKPGGAVYKCGYQYRHRVCVWVCI